MGGRWPANVILSPGMAKILDEQTGILPGGTSHKAHHKHENVSSWDKPSMDFEGYGDKGGASRFFLQAGYEPWELEWISENGLRPCGMEPPNA